MGQWTRAPTIQMVPPSIYLIYSQYYKDIEIFSITGQMMPAILNMCTIVTKSQVRLLPTSSFSYLNQTSMMMIELFMVRIVKITLM